MKFKATSISGAFILDVEKIGDERGFFGRVFCDKEFEAHGIDFHMRQANIGFNQFKGTLRGLHYQVYPYGEAKLVKCTAGALFDVIVDLRPASPTCMQWLGVEMSAANRRMLYLPEGCAHGYLTLVDATEIFYSVSQYYHPDAERGVRWNDPAFNIEWPMTQGLVISAKDRNWPDYQATDFNDVPERHQGEKR
jgi:dTDP-4-dehydrorhamnose 3,5-epimerase